MSVESRNPFSAGIIIAMIGVGLASFIAVFALIGWAPELASKNRAAQTPYSTSALGYAGLIEVLRADGQTVTVSRLERTREVANGLLIITIPPGGFRRADSFDVDDVSEPVLYVLPKWFGQIDPRKREWQDDTGLLQRRSVARLVNTFDDNGDIWRLRNPGTINTLFGDYTPDFEHKMQVIESDTLVPVVEVAGGSLIARIPGKQAFILSDPDVLNTFGLARRENAAFGLGFIDWLQSTSGGDIIFDATVHGFARDESLMRVIFDAPFIGATLLAIATILLIGWAAFIRFGPPVREVRKISFGKRALAESSAGLVSMGRREGKMAPSYLDLTRRWLIRRLGLPAALSQDELDTVLDRIAAQKELGETWTTQKTRLSQDARGRDDLTDKAAKAWRWRKQMSDGDA